MLPNTGKFPTTGFRAEFIGRSLGLAGSGLGAYTKVRGCRLKVFEG